MSNTSEQSVDLTSKPLTTISGHEYSIRRIECLPGGTRIVTCSFDDTVRIWNVETGEQEGMSIAHEGCVYGLAVTKDGKRVLSGGEDKRIRVWDVESRELVEEWESHLHSIYHIALSPNDRLAASGGDQGEIVMRRVEEGGRMKYSIDAGGNSDHGYDAVLSLCFSPSGEKLACAVGNMVGKPGVITVYDTGTGELVVGPIQGHEDVVCSVLWSLDGPSRLFSASYDHTIRCWNSDTGEPIGEPWRGHTDRVESLSLSPDGTKLASSSYDKTIRYWDARSGDPINQPLQHEELSAVTFSPSGEFVTVARDNKVSRLCVPRWNDSQKRAHQYSFLDLPAVPGPNDQHQYVEFLDVSYLHMSARPSVLQLILVATPEN
ncbi:WD40 repeat-like protein [Paxillus ammoniavirescens]|nr:WD40 repeat-like protein [Paxillus ammoniavirescens]